MDEVNNVRLSGDHEEKAVGQAMLENIYFYGNISTVVTKTLEEVLAAYKLEVTEAVDENRRVTLGVAISRIGMELEDRKEQATR